MDIKELSKKVNITLNSKPEKMIMAGAISTALAILTIPGKRRKKGSPNFFQRIGKFYNSVDRLLVMTVAKDVAAEEKRRASVAGIKNSKLRDMEIIDAIPIDLSEEE
ncbi:MAG: hypothetical protein J6I46_08255 [Ruminococcus sp.]|nr:hypothetical protein [Ruminococcus sp.]